MEIKCKFFYQGWLPFFENEYMCEVKRKQILDTTRKFKFLGTHTSKNTNSDVRKLKFYKCQVLKIPFDLTRLFVNLNALYLYKCNVKEISRSDLRNLTQLRDLRVESDTITHLPGNLLSEMKNLQVLSFKDNRIKYINPNIIHDLNDLKFLDLSGNASINLVYNPPFGTSTTMETINQHIISKCKPPHGTYDVYERQPAYFDRGQFSDANFEEISDNSNNVHGIFHNHHTDRHSIHNHHHNHHMDGHNHHHHNRSSHLPTSIGFVNFDDQNSLPSSSTENSQISFIAPSAPAFDYNEAPPPYDFSSSHVSSDDWK